MTHPAIYENAPVGVNLGGWLSQYKAYDHAHFQSFITAADIRQIADWGMDHIRLPFDYQILESDAQPGTYIESGFDYLESCLEWCEANQLSVALDMHHAPGYSFTNTLEGDNAGNTLFDSALAQERFFALWDAIAKRFHGRYPKLAFELLNEIVLPESGPWNRLAKQAVARMRQSEPDRDLIIGGNIYASVFHMKDLKLIDDPRIVYTFHFYDPLIFTHQRAPWAPLPRTMDATVDYPGEAPGLVEFAARHPEFAGSVADLIGKPMDRAMLYSYVEEALVFQQRAAGRPLYCGEFGVIDRAPAASSRNWLRDFVSILNEHKIGRAIWSYKQMDFGLVDAHSKVVDPEFVKIASSR